jgi:hypothetical protein
MEELKLISPLELIRAKAMEELTGIMDKWCENYSENFSGGKMRGDRGADIEEFVRKTINRIGLEISRDLVAVKGSSNKKELKIQLGDKEIKKDHQVDIAAIHALSEGMQRLRAIADAVEALIAPEPLRQKFLEQQRLVQLLHAAIKPDPAAQEFAASVGALNSIAASIRLKLNPNPPDISAVMGRIGQVFDQSITGIAIRDQGPPSIDLSKIDFQALADKFKTKRNKKTELEELKALIAAHLARMVQLNPTRTDFREKFEALIESYNAGSRSIEEP